MDIIYTGKEVKKMLSESIPGYKPKFGNEANPSKNEKEKYTNEQRERRKDTSA